MVQLIKTQEQLDDLIKLDPMFNNINFKEVQGTNPILERVNFNKEYVEVIIRENSISYRRIKTRCP